MKNSLCGMVFSSENHTSVNKVTYVPNFKSTSDTFYLYLDRVSMIKEDNFVHLDKISEYRMISNFDRTTNTLHGKEDLAKMWVYSRDCGCKVMLDDLEENASVRPNEDLADYVRQVVYALNPELFKKFEDWVVNESISSLVVYMDDLDNIEKLFSTMERQDITWQLTQQAFEFNDGKKLKSVIGMPVDLISKANEHGLGSHVHLMQQCLKKYNVTVDEIRLYFDFISAINLMSKKRRISINDVNSSTSFCLLFEAIKNGANLRFLVNTLARDMLFYNSLDSVQLVNSCRYLRDIYNMLKTMNLPIDVSPNISKCHSIVSRNYQIFKKSRAEEYAAAAKHLNDNYSIIVDGYLIKCPETEQELFEIGNKYNNCLPTYRDRVIDENVMIFSVYQLDDDNNVVESIPSVTFEVSKYFDFIQVKTFFDVDVTDENMIEVLQTWKKRVKNK